MIITCPECESQFLVNAKAIGTGRTVKCASCGHTWFQEPVEEEKESPDTIGKPTQPPAKEPSSQETESAPEDSLEKETAESDSETEDTNQIPSEGSGEKSEEREESETSQEDVEEDETGSAEEETKKSAEETEESDDAPLDNEPDEEKDHDQAASDAGDDEFIDDEILEDDDDLDDVLKRLQGGVSEDKKDMDPIPKGLGPNESDDLEKAQHKSSGKKRSGLGIIIIVLALLTGTLLAAILNKTVLVQAWPPSAGLFNMIGMPVSAIGEGLGFTDITASIKETETVTYLVIRGKIDNNTDGAITIPAMKVEMKEGDAVLQDWVIPSEDYVIGAGESVPFEYGLPDPIEKSAESVTVTFATPSDIVAASSP